MPYILVTNSVQDFEKWKTVYDKHGATRREGGSKGTQVFRNADDPDEVVVLLEWDAPDNERRFTESQDLREAMQRAGVTGVPDVRFDDRVHTSGA